MNEHPPPNRYAYTFMLIATNIRTGLLTSKRVI